LVVAEKDPAAQGEQVLPLTKVPGWQSAGGVVHAELLVLPVPVVVPPPGQVVHATWPTFSA
jgi:hypothetical protein